MEPLFSRVDYNEFDHFNFKQAIACDVETFEAYSKFDIDSLESESVLKQIKVDLLKDMLTQKPHYARFFTELEDELIDAGFLAHGKL